MSRTKKPMRELETVVHTKSSAKKKTSVQLTFECQIEEFDSLMRCNKPGKSLWSEDASSNLVPNAKWKLRVYPNCIQSGYASVYLYFTGEMTCKNETLETRYHIYLVKGALGDIDSIHRGTYEFGEEGCYYRPEHGFERISHDRLRNALQQDGSLVVAAEVEFPAPNNDDDSSARPSPSYGPTSPFYSPIHHTDEDLHQPPPTKSFKLCGDESAPDCSIEIGGVTIRAHKCVLVANSAVFRAMFADPQREESRSGVVKISRDFKHPEPMRVIIRHFYRGHFDVDTMGTERLAETFKLADKFGINELKARLERHFIEKGLCVENVVEMAVFAEAHSVHKLKEACINLIARQWKTVYESAAWMGLKEVDSKLTTDLAEGVTRVLADK